MHACALQSYLAFALLACEYIHHAKEKQLQKQIKVLVSHDYHTDSLFQQKLVLFFCYLVGVRLTSCCIAMQAAKHDHARSICCCIMYSFCLSEIRLTIITDERQKV